MVDTKAQTTTKKKARARIDNELAKVETVMAVGKTFSSVNTYAEFLVEAKKLFEAYGYEYKESMFTVIKRPKSDGNSKKNK